MRGHLQSASSIEHLTYPHPTKQALHKREIKKTVLADINRRSQFLHPPIQVAKNGPNHTRRAPIAPVDCGETSLLLAVQLAPRHTLAALKVGGI